MYLRKFTLNKVVVSMLSIAHFKTKSLKTGILWKVFWRLFVWKEKRHPPQKKNFKAVRRNQMLNITKVNMHKQIYMYIFTRINILLNTNKTKANLSTKTAVRIVKKRYLLLYGSNDLSHIENRSIFLGQSLS